MMLPHHIATRCILNAKSDECKTRLVRLTEMSVQEDIKRIVNPKKFDPFYTEPSAKDILNIFNIYRKEASWKDLFNLFIKRK